MIKFSDLIYVKENVLSIDFCNKVIEKFEEDTRKGKGYVVGNEIDISYKNCTDLMISNLSNWEEEDSTLFKCSSSLLDEYNNYCMELFPSLHFYSKNWRYSDNGYQIQRYNPGEYFEWHHDFDLDPNMGSRMVTILWYLNDLDGEGHTEFLNGDKITPKAGRCVLYPATWDYVHRGVSPLEKTKYIIVSVLYGMPNYQ